MMTNHTAYVMVHDAHTNTSGKRVVRDFIIKADELKRKNEVLIHLLASDSNMTVDEMRNLMERDNYMAAQEAMAKGFIDFIVDSPVASFAPTVEPTSNSGEEVTSEEEA